MSYNDVTRYSTLLLRQIDQKPVTLSHDKLCSKNALQTGQETCIGVLGCSYATEDVLGLLAFGN